MLLHIQVENLTRYLHASGDGDSWIKTGIKNVSASHEQNSVCKIGGTSQPERRAFIFHITFTDC